MKVVVQRVSQASVDVVNELGTIEHGRASRLWRRVQHIAGTQNLGISVGLLI